MRKNVSVILAAALLCACGEPRYIIRGDVKGLDGMVYMLDSKRNPVDSVMAVNGRFEFSGQFTDARRCFITDNSDLASISKYVLLFIEKGRIYVQENEKGLYAVGTPSNNAYTAMLGRTARFTEEYNARRSTVGRSGQVAVEYDDMLLQSVRDNLDNMFGLYQFEALLNDLDEQQAVDLLEQFSDEVKESDLWKSYMDNIRAILSVTTGKPYADFTQNTPEGVGLSLRSVVENPDNRYVLLDFWASWCAPCISEIPSLKNCYARYHSRGFEILGISLDHDRESWSAAIKAKGLNWLHVSDIGLRDNTAATIYAVRSIPANFLIDCSAGTIIARDLRGGNLEAKLSELLD